MLPRNASCHIVENLCIDLYRVKKVFYTHETILFKCFEIKQVENLTMEVQPRKFCLGVKAILQSGFTVYAVD